jgi:glycosyltransferase involved in cell wall biosynthesis
LTLKVCFIHHSFSRDLKGEGEIGIFNIAAKLIERGHQVHIITRRLRCDQKKVDSVGGIDVTRVPIFRTESMSNFDELLVENLFDPDVTLGIQNALETIRPNVVNVGLIKGFSLAPLIIPKANNIPTFYTMHDYWAICVRRDFLDAGKHICKGYDSDRCKKCLQSSGIRVWESILKFRAEFIKKLDYILTRNENATKTLRENGICGKTKVIAGCIDSQLFRPKNAEVSKFSFVEKGEPSLLYVGRLNRREGISELLQALPRIIKDFPRCKLAIVGYGDLSTYVRKLSVVLGIKNHVSFFEWIPNEEMPEIYNRSDIVVVPSLWPNPFSRTVAEAMACGRPVIASRVEGISEMITHGKNGFLIPPNDQEALVLSIKEILDNKKLARKIGWDARREVTMKCDSDKISENFLKICEEVSDIR